MIHKLKKWIWKDEHPKNKDPLRKLYVHVGMLMIFVLGALAFMLLYLKVPASPEQATSFVIYDYPRPEIIDDAGVFIQNVKESPHHSHIMLTLYVLWIIIVGMVAMFITEYRREKH